ncbi:hypothetical protein [Leuconostoc citreum]|uniref:hypothetical protein n=1 Tax=Leuconostoc citreum TaxID=33964 RepID=UPI0032DE2F1E
MNKEILNYLDEIHIFYRNYIITAKTEAKLKVKENKIFRIFKGWVLISMFIMGILVFFGLAMFYKTIWLRNYWYLIYVLDVLNIAFSSGLYGELKMKQREETIKYLENSINMEQLSINVFKNVYNIPNMEQLNLLKKILNNKFKTNQNTRNVLVAVFIFVFISLRPTLDTLISKLISKNPDIFFNILIIPIAFGIFVYSANRSSKVSVVSQWFIKDNDDIQHLDNLFDYLIFKQKSQ